VVSGDTGLLVDVEERESVEFYFSKAIQHILTLTKEEYSTMSQNSYNHAINKFSLDSFANQLEIFMNEAKSFPNQKRSKKYSTIFFITIFCCLQSLLMVITRLIFPFNVLNHLNKT